MKISTEAKEFIETQGIFVLGTVNENNLPNISPRIFFRVDDNVIYWIDFFKHKSFKNFQRINNQKNFGEKYIIQSKTNV